MMPRTEVSLEADILHLFNWNGRNTDYRTHPGSWVWCSSCRSNVKPISTAEAEILTRVCSRIIRRQVEAGLIHYIETSDGLHHVCPNSL